MDSYGVVSLILGTVLIISFITSLYDRTKNHKEKGIFWAIILICWFIAGIFFIIGAFLPDLRSGIFHILTIISIE